MDVKSPIGTPLATATAKAHEFREWTSRSFSTSQIIVTTLVIAITLLVLEQSLWRWRKGKLPGSKWQIPIIGQFAESLNPTMEAYKRSWASPLAAVSVFNIFIVMANTTDFARRVLNASNLAEPCLVRSAKDVLLPENWVFLNGKAHAEYRKGLNTLFTREALSIYLKMQDKIYRRYFAEWLKDPVKEPQPYQMKFRDLNMETSLRVFCGSYIKDEHAQEVSDKYWLITTSLELVNFPFNIPGTKVWKACQARATTVKYLENAAAQSKIRMSQGGEVTCLLDEWVMEILASKRYQEDPQNNERPQVLLRDYSDHEMALVLLSFIFASQDAMSSSITYAFQDLADHPEVLEKVRQEQAEVRGGDYASPMTLDLLDQMPYTTAVSREVLRHRPPVIMVPYKATKPFPIDGVVIPKNTMLIPSFWNSLHDPEVYPNPDDFIPERWLPGGANYREGSDGTDSKNWLVFGAGAHRCIGQSYVMMHMTSLIGTAASLMNWEHERTPESDEIAIIATIFPKDGCRLKFTPRDTPETHEALNELLQSQ